MTAAPVAGSGPAPSDRPRRRFSALRQVLTVLLILGAIPALLLTFIVTLPVLVIDDHTTPSTDIGVATIEGREVAIVPYELSGPGGLFDAARYIESETTVRITAVDLDTGDELWDTSIWSDYPALDSAGVVAVGSRYAYLAGDKGLVVVELESGAVVTRDDGIAGLGGAYLAARTAYAFDPVENAIVTLTSAGDVLAIPLDDTAARPARPAVVSRWRDKLNLDDDRKLFSGSESVETLRSITEPDGNLVLPKEFGDRRSGRFVAAPDAPDTPVGVDSGFVVTAVDEHQGYTLSVSDRRTFETRGSYRSTASIRQVVRTPTGRVLMLTTTDNIGVLVVATADGLDAYPIGEKNFLGF